MRLTRAIEKKIREQLLRRACTANNSYVDELAFLKWSAVELAGVDRDIRAVRAGAALVKTGLSSAGKQVASSAALKLGCQLGSSELPFLPLAFFVGATMNATTLPAATIELVLSALQTAAISPHHPWCRMARSGPRYRCDCHVAAASRAVELIASTGAPHSAAENVTKSTPVVCSTAL